MSKAKKSAPAVVVKKSASKKSAPAVAPVVEAPAQRQRSQRITIFNHSLTSVMKRLSVVDGARITAAQAQAIMNKLAQQDCSAVKLSTLTTALSDGRSVKYNAPQAPLTKAQIDECLKIARTVAPVAQAPIAVVAPVAQAPVVKSASKSKRKSAKSAS